MKDKQLRLFTFIVLAYMLLAFVWWSVLLFTKNRDAFQAKVELQKMGMVAEGLVTTEADFYSSERYLELEKHYRRQEYMIIGESLALILSVLAGIYIISGAFKREMEAARQQRNFLLSITHELKSPLAGIRLVLETLLRRSLNAEQIRRLGENGMRETDRLTKLVEDLLLSARLETAYQPNREPIDLEELLSDCLERMRHKQADFQWIFTCTDHVPVIEGDKAGLHSVVTNLLENAAKYSLPPAKITLSLRKIDNQWLEISVCDEGMGIPDAEKAKVFEKFYRVGNEDTRRTKGTGLGLFIVREIVRAHKGVIELTDNKPKGTVFNIRLPLFHFATAAAK